MKQEKIASVLTEEMSYMMKSEERFDKDVTLNSCRFCRVILKDMMTGMQLLFRNL
jgi:hypothetical protein